MTFTLEIKMDNAAFDDNLRELADNIEHHPHFSAGHGQPVRDVNGNETGYFHIED